MKNLKRGWCLCKALFEAPSGETKGTPGHLARVQWGDGREVMRTMLLSMTPPIPVHNKDAVPYIESCISGQVTDRLTEEAILGNELIQLYVLSYRHESENKTERISKERLHKVVDVIRTHTTHCGQSYYSIWIDSLFYDEWADPLADWADRGMSPYSFCYVVVSPSNDGFEADLKRAWIRCEHQLAVSARGMLLHPSHERPSSGVGRKERSEEAYIYIRGGTLESRFAMRALAIAISYGLLKGAKVSFESDLQTLKKWSMRMLCSKWPGYFSNIRNPDRCADLPGPIALDAPVREGRMERLLTNVAHINIWGTIKISPDWDVIGEIQMIRHNGPTRTWDTGYEIARAVCGDMTLSKYDGFTKEIFVKISERSVAYIVKGDFTVRGLVTCKWSFDSDCLLLDVEMFQGSDGIMMITGYSMIHSAKLRKACYKLRGQIFLREFLDSLNKYYTKLSLRFRAKELYPVDSWKWHVSEVPES